MPASIQTILARAARRCSYDPDIITFFGGSDPSGTEMVEYLESIADDIITRVDAAPFSATYYISGQSDTTLPYSAVREFPNGTRDVANFTRGQLTGTPGSLFLPNYTRRLQRGDDAVLEISGVRRKVRPVANGADWAALVSWGPQGASRYYRLLGQPGELRLDFWQPLLSGVVVAVSVVTDRWLRAGSPIGAYSNVLASGDDVPVIPERILEDGIVGKFRERRGLPYADVLGKFEAALMTWSAETKPRQSVSLIPSQPLDINALKPLVPDYIPQ